MIDRTLVFNNYLGASFPNFAGKNASGATAVDGTEWLAAYVDNWGWGWEQALLNYEGITPNGTTEADGASQITDAIQNILPPGCIVEWNLNTDPATYGARFLLLNGQGILRANYSELDANVYVGDANNAAVAAAGGGFFRADDAAGTTPNITGVYLILPESRGYTTRGLDLAASVDPAGASRVLGDNQNFALQNHDHDFYASSGTSGSTPAALATDAAATLGLRNLRVNAQSSGVITYTGFGTALIDVETRMTNRSTQFAIRY
jgi:hypothetical protein